MVNLVLHIGSNIGNREENLSRCISLLDIHLGTIIIASEVYSTEAWGIKDQPDFLNQALVVATSMSPEEVHRMTTKVECIIGKEKEYIWGPRRIDIDIIFYGDQILNLANLVIAHPRMENRRFVLEPLLEIIPDFVHPVSGKTIKEMYNECDDPSYVSLLQSEQIA